MAKLKKKILAFGASTSSTSINQQLAEFAATLVEGAEVETIQLTTYYPCKMFSVDEEAKNGFPDNASSFKHKLEQYDGFIISCAEHNGSYTAAFKNLFDWASRMEGGVWNNKPVLVMGTSPGARGAQFVIEAAKNRFPFNGASMVTGTFSLPGFHDNFSTEEGILDKEKLEELKQRLRELVNVL